jgi:hypothetical protein
MVELFIWSIYMYKQYFEKPILTATGELNLHNQFNFENLLNDP